MKSVRDYSLQDKFCMGVDQALRAMFGKNSVASRPYPAANTVEPLLTAAQQKQSSGMMRVNHAGEVCAQALYHGQGLASRSRAVKENMQQAAIEENDHLAWCRQRLQELGSHTSLLDPCWYLGSLGLGLFAGLLGDAWSLSFLAETEDQVVKHLQRHLVALPREDEKSQLILQQMQTDEAQHRDGARQLGALALPRVVKQMMRLASGMMVKIAYYI